MANEKPVRGEVWNVNLDPVRGHEQGGGRPAVIVSVDQFNQGPSGLVIVVPITSKDKNIRSQVAIEAGEGGLNLVAGSELEDIEHSPDFLLPVYNENLHELRLFTSPAVSEEAGIS